MLEKGNVIIGLFKENCVLIEGMVSGINLVFEISKENVSVISEMEVMMC